MCLSESVFNIIDTAIYLGLTADRLTDLKLSYFNGHNLTRYGIKE